VQIPFKSSITRSVYDVAIVRDSEYKVLYCGESILELGSEFGYLGKRIPNSDLYEVESVRPLS